jgi:hypothetical protein
MLWVSVIPAALRAAPLFDFDGSVQGWINDTSVYYRNNFQSPPAVTGSVLHSGSGALALTLDFTDQESYGVTDAVYVQPAVLDLSAETGLAFYVRWDGGSGNGNPFYPLTARLYLKTGPFWFGYKGVDVALVPGRWKKVFINFNNAFNYDAVGAPAVVVNRNDVKEIGLHVFGAKYNRGTATVYLDSVEAGLGDDAAAPASPGGVSAAGGVNTVSLQWNPVAAADLDHYTLYRSTQPGGLAGKTVVKSAGAGTASLVDESVVGGLSYFYQLTAVDKSGNESAPSTEASGSPLPPSAVFSGPIKGMSYVSWSSATYAGPDSRSSLDDLMSTGAGMVALVVTQYMSQPSAASIAPDLRTPTDAALTTAINDIHARGMKVMLKPHVDVNDGTWRGAIVPADPAGWFSAYVSFITHYAQLAQSNGVELFCLGTELKSMTDKRRADWTGVINAVKGVYTGPVTYAANAFSAQDEFSQIDFWDLLDHVGLDVYFPLTGRADPNLGELEAAWSLNRLGESPLEIVSAWRNYTGKDVIFTEIGYRSVDGANIDPPNFVTGSSRNLGEQDRAYRAALTAWNDRPWMKGLFWWRWDPDPNAGGASNIDYMPQDKPALQTLTSAYGGESVRSFYDFSAGTQAWTADFTTDFENNLGAPTGGNPAGNPALEYPLDLGVHSPTFGGINDFAYVQPVIPKDLEGYQGLKARVLIPVGAGVDATFPVKAALVVQTGTGFDWYQSNSFRTLSPGQWREVSLDFQAAFSQVSGQQGPDKPVGGLADVRRIGVAVSGADTGVGTTFFYVDDVATRGQGAVLGLSIGPTGYSFGTQGPLGRIQSSVPIGLENSGNQTVRYLLSCSSSTPTGWGPSSTAPAGPGSFVLNAQFNSTVPADFVESRHAVSLVPAAGDATRFAGDEQGAGVSPSGMRHLWLELGTPPVRGTADTAPQAISLNVTAEIE